MRNFLILFGLILISGCKENANTSKFSDKLDNLTKRDSLFIQADFADCGEWGGHKERIVVFRVNENELMLNFEKDTVNCPDPQLFNRRIIENKTKKLTMSDRIEIYKFLEEVLERSIGTDDISNAANYYLVKTNNKNVNIVFNDYNMSWKGFENLKKSILTETN